MLHLDREVSNYHDGNQNERSCSVDTNEERSKDLESHNQQPHHSMHNRLIQFPQVLSQSVNDPPHRNPVKESTQIRIQQPLDHYPVHLTTLPLQSIDQNHVACHKQKPYLPEYLQSPEDVQDRIRFLRVLAPVLHQHCRIGLANCQTDYRKQNYESVETPTVQLQEVP